MKPIDPTSRLAGPAYTVDCRPGDNLVLHHAVLKARPGDEQRFRTTAHNLEQHALGTAEPTVEQALAWLLANANRT
jgi:hypothetical protein